MLTAFSADAILYLGDGMFHPDALLFAQMYNQRPEEVAGVVIVSTVLGFCLLPVLLMYLL